MAAILRHKFVCVPADHSRLEFRCTAQAMQGHPAQDLPRELRSLCPRPMQSLLLEPLLRAPFSFPLAVAFTTCHLI